MSKTLPVLHFPRVPIVTTWTLWGHLFSPPAHPLFKRARQSAPAALPVRAILSWLIPLSGGLACCGTWVLLLQAGSSTPIFLLVTTGLFSTVYASWWAINTSVAIARQQAHGTYDALCTTPAGGLGVHWALCAASLHRKEMLEWIETLRRATTMILIFVFMLIVMLVTSQEKTLDPAVPLAMLLELVSLAIFPYLEHVQATVLGSLVGMSMPLLAGGTVGARLWAALGFLGLQFGVILATLVSVVLAAPRLPPAISPLVFGLLAFCLIREATVIVLWRALAHRLGTDPARIDLALG